MKTILCVLMLMSGSAFAAQECSVEANTLALTLTKVAFGSVAKSPLLKGLGEDEYSHFEATIMSAPIRFGNGEVKSVVMKYEIILDNDSSFRCAVHSIRLAH